MSKTLIGAGVAAVLSLTWLALGFWAFVLVAVAMLVGSGVGRVFEGRLDLRSLADALRGRRSSS